MSKEIRRVITEPHVTEADLQIAAKMEAKGVPLPENLKAPYEAHKAKLAEQNGGQPPKKEEPPKPPEAPTPPETPKAPENGTPPPKEPVGSEEKRPVRYIPVKEFNDKETAWKTEKADLVRQIETLNAGKNGDETKKEWKAKIAAVAEKTGMSAEDIEAIASLFRGESDKLPAATERKLEGEPAQPPKAPEPPKPPAAPATPAAPQKTKEELDKEFWAKQDSEFESDFAKALAEPGADPTMADRKEAIKKAAFTAGNEHKSLWEIDTRIVKPKADKAKKSPDTPGGIPGGGTGEAADFEVLATDPTKQREFFRTATMDQKEKFTEFMGRRSGSKLRRNGKPVN